MSKPTTRKSKKVAVDEALEWSEDRRRDPGYVELAHGCFRKQVPEEDPAPRPPNVLFDPREDDDE